MKRWWSAHRDMLSEAGLKQPQAAVIKSHGSERWGKSQTRSGDVRYREMSYPEPMLTRRYVQIDIKTRSASIFWDKFTTELRMLRNRCPAYSRHDSVSGSL